MKAIYISGPMSGLPEFNFPAFEECATRLRYFGHTVISPHEKGGEGEAGDEAWNRYLRADVIQMMGCDAIALLPGWPNSKGARVELALALGLGFKVFYWLDGVLVAA